jgi:hypothetical protein
MIEWTRSAGCTSPVSLAYGCETDKGVVQYCLKTRTRMRLMACKLQYAYCLFV